jgi:hypothetical protein
MVRKSNSGNFFKASSQFDVIETDLRPSPLSWVLPDALD